MSLMATEERSRGGRCYRFVTSIRSPCRSHHPCTWALSADGRESGAPMTVRAEHLGFAGTSPPREGAPWTARHHTGLTARDPGGVHAEGCPPRPPCRRVRTRLYPRLPSPALRPECAWWSPAPMTVPATGRNSHERYTPGNAGAAAAGASGDPAGPATAPSGDARPAAVVRCRASPPGGAAPGRVRLQSQLLFSPALYHTHLRN